MSNTQYYLALDIETGGTDKPIFALGAAVFRIHGSVPEFFEEGMWNFPVPENYDTAYYDEDTWHRFWGTGQNFAVLKTMNRTANCAGEKEVITSFYTWYASITNKYDNIRIVTDEPTFDVGYTDKKISLYIPDSVPLRFQHRGDKRIFTSTLDYNTFELLFEMTFPSNDCPHPTLASIWGELPYVHDHNPLNDSNYMAYKFAKLFTFLQGKITACAGCLP
jgi:hypothetical protein